MAAKSNWNPKTKAEHDMDRAYRHLSRSDRMTKAVQFVLDDAMTVSAAARKFGVDRSACSRKVSAERKRRTEQAERAARAKAENVAAFDDGRPEPAVPEPEPEPPVEGMLPDGPVRAERRVPSFREFNDRYFSNEICPDCDGHHETPDFHLEVMDLLEDRAKRLKLINFAPYHAKSTICTFKSTLYELVRDPTSRTAIISAGGDLAEAMLYQIKEHLTDPDLYNGAAGNLIEDWGPFYNPGHWGKDSIYIYGRSGAQKDPSVSTYGFGKKIYGRRFDRMIFDDVADMENQNTPEAIQKMYRKIWQEYVNRVGKTGQIIFVGTRVMPGDVYSLLDDVEGMNVFRRPCILDEESGVTLWPDHYPIRSALEQKAAMSVEQFQLVYQNVDTPGFGASFPPDVLERSHDPSRYQGHFDPGWMLVLGVDPAGANAQAGHTAMVVLAVDPVSGRRYLVDLVNQKQMKAPQIMDQIFDWSERYPLRELRVEVNGLQMLPAETPILTRSGWSTMGGLSVGDEVAAPDGSWTRVRAVGDTSTEQMWAMEFSDGTSLDSHDGHRWWVQPISKGDRALPERFMTTAEIRGSWDRFKRFRVRAPEPLDGVEADLPLDPYVFGAWLGDGTTGMAQFTQDDSRGDLDELRACVELAGFETRLQSGRSRFGVLGMLPALRATGAFHDKHVPDVYLRGSFKQRLALLQGLMDADGTITGPHGHAVFYNTNPRLIEAVGFLLRSLGYRPRPARWHSHRRDVPIGVIKFYPNTDLPNPFRLSRKAERVQPRTKDRSRWLTVRSLSKSGVVPGLCIQVEHPSETFLAGRELIPTGNSQIFQYNAELQTRMSNRGVRVVPHITHKGNKFDPQFGVEAMSTLYHNGVISTPWQDINSREKFKMLEEQLQQFPMGAVSDLVMALWFAELGCKEIMQRQTAPSFDPRMRVPSRVASKRRILNFGERSARLPGQDDMVSPLHGAPDRPADTRLVNVAPGVTVA